MRYTFLTKEFYEDYAHCKEIEQKLMRPYIQVCVEINSTLFAIPLRSNIQHKHVVWTDKSNKCGLDLSKAVVITKTEYLNNTDDPYIRPNERRALFGKEYIVKGKLLAYIRQYKKASLGMSKKHNRLLCQYSTLQYFEEFI